jgi:hypothetical protein
MPSRPSATTRPAVVVVLDGSRPAGLSDADVTYEEVTSPLRYLAVFQSHQAKVVGPVGGTRPVDGQELSVLRPLLGYDGGTASFIKVLDHTDVVDVGAQTHDSAYTGGSSGITTSTGALRDAGHSVTPPALLAYRGPDTGNLDLASTGEWRPSSVTVRLAGHGTQKWTFDAKRDLWQQTSGGPPIEVANLIIQTVRYKEVFLSRKDGLTAPSARAFGRGSFEAFSGIADSAAHGAGGLAARGTWSKPGLPYVTAFVDAKGFPMNFQPGPTWVILAPRGTRVQTTEATS